MFLISIISLLLLSGSPQENQRGDVRVYETTLHFRWNQTNYQENYLTNADAAEKLCRMLEEIGLENIDSVSVVAYASPEGVYEHNLQLSRSRAREFNAAVRERIGLGGNGFRLDVRPGGEAWELLRTRVMADTAVSAAARSRILKVLDDNSVSTDTKKWRMAHNYLGATPQEGDVYHWLLLNHYRYLRCLAVKIYINYDKDTTATLIPDTTTTDIPDTTTTDIPDTTTTLIPATEPESPADTTAVATPKEEMPDQVRNEEETVGHEEETVGHEEPSLIPGSDQESPNVIPAIPDQPTAPTRGTPIIGLSTNLPYDITYIPGYGLTSVPSFSLEYYPAKGHYTFGADVDWSHWLHWNEHRYNQIHNITLWGRRYFKTGEEGFRGTYLFANLNAAEYGLGWDEKGWEGEGAGISLGIGHKWTFGPMFLDLGLGAGFFYSRYDPYVWGNDSTGWYYYDYTGDPNKFKPRRMALYWFGPTRAYISIGIDLFKRRR